MVIALISLICRTIGFLSIVGASAFLTVHLNDPRYLLILICLVLTVIPIYNFIPYEETPPFDFQPDFDSDEDDNQDE